MKRTHRNAHPQHFLLLRTKPQERNPGPNEQTTQAQWREPRARRQARIQQGTGPTLPQKADNQLANTAYSRREGKRPPTRRGRLETANVGFATPKPDISDESLCRPQENNAKWSELRATSCVFAPNTGQHLEIVHFPKHRRPGHAGVRQFAAGIPGPHVGHDIREACVKLVFCFFRCKGCNTRRCLSPNGPGIRRGGAIRQGLTSRKCTPNRRRHVSPSRLRREQQVGSRQSRRAACFCNVAHCRRYGASWQVYDTSTTGARNNLRPGTHVSDSERWQPTGGAVVSHAINHL